VVRVSANRFFLPSAVRQLEQIAASMEQITAAAFRDRSGIGRNLAIEVLEFFDRTRRTRRVGDAHVLIRDAR
jgi:selenocysteine-specific elongation factor